jgi:hypothetical protein
VCLSLPPSPFSHSLPKKCFTSLDWKIAENLISPTVFLPSQIYVYYTQNEQKYFYLPSIFYFLSGFTIIFNAIKFKKLARNLFSVICVYLSFQTAVFGSYYSIGYYWPHWYSGIIDLVINWFKKHLFQLFLKRMVACSSGHLIYPVLIRPEWDWKWRKFNFVWKITMSWDERRRFEILSNCLSNVNEALSISLSVSLPLSLSFFLDSFSFLPYLSSHLSIPIFPFVLLFALDPSPSLVLISVIHAWNLLSLFFVAHTLCMFVNVSRVHITGRKCVNMSEVNIVYTVVYRAWICEL